MRHRVIVAAALAAATLVTVPADRAAAVPTLADFGYRSLLVDGVAAEGRAHF